MSNEPFPNGEWIAEYREVLTGDELVRSIAEPARFSSLIRMGDVDLLLEVDEGDIDLNDTPTMADPWDFAVSGEADAWRQFVQGERDPEYANFVSMTFQGAMSITGETESHMTFEGDYRKLFAHLELLYEAFELMRAVGGAR